MSNQKKGTIWYMLFTTILVGVLGWMAYDMFDTLDAVLLVFLVAIILLGSAIRYNQ